MMTDVSRRTFLGGALAITALAVVPLAKKLGVPILYCDGVHDDTVALQALLDGNPVKIEGEVIAISDGSEVYLKGGCYKISDTIRVRNGMNVSLENIYITMAEPYSGTVFAVKAASPA